MKRIAIFGMLSLTASCAMQEPPQQLAQQAQPPLAVAGATVIDARTGSRIENATIIVEAGQIAAITPSSNAEVPAAAHIIDARGKYVIPGLWDLHIHIRSQDELDLFFPLLVAHGVLGFRDTGGLLPREFVAGSERHQYVPRVIAAGPIINGPAPEGEEDAAVVDSLVAEGVDYIKIGSRVPRERFLAMAERAAELGIHVAGHVPITVNAADASDAGLRTMEHFLEIHLAISEDESDLRQTRVAAIDQEYSIRSVGFPPLEPLLAAWSDDKASALFGRLVANRTWQVPTLADFRAWAASGKSSFWEDDRLSLLPESWLESWRPDQHREFRDIPPAELPAFYAHLDNWYRAQLEMTRRMHDAGVGFLAGTDASAGNFQVPGATLHDELASFVDAGFTSLEALQTATVNVADYLEIEGYDGTVSVGQEADFVLLDADPVADIQNTTQIFAVVLDGSFIDRRALDELLEAAKRHPVAAAQD